MKNHEQTIKLNKRFYDKEALLLTKKRFEDVADLEIIESSREYIVTLKENKCGENHILQEFANHCLAECK